MIMVDDSRVILVDSLSVLEEVLPNAAITGFIRPSEAIEYAKANRVALAVLDRDVLGSLLVGKISIEVVDASQLASGMIET